MSASASTKFRPYAVSPELFSEHMEALVDLGRAVLSLGDYLAPERTRDRKPAVVLTFDDGFLDFHSAVMPALARHKIRGTAYIPTAYVGRSSRWLESEGEGDRPVMSWSQLKEALSAGVEIGSHSRTHRQLDLLRPEELHAELVDSRSELEDQLQHSVTSFAYPFRYHTTRVKRAVARAGYTSACAVRDLPDDRGDAFRVSRLTVGPDTTGEDLRDMVLRSSAPWGPLRASSRGVASRLLRRARLKRRGPLPGGSPPVS